MDKHVEEMDHFTDSVALESIEGLTDITNGAYFPYTGIIKIDCKFVEHFEELQNHYYKLSSKEIVEASKNKTNPTIPDTFLHEQRHSLHTAGSTLGSIFYLASNFQLQIMDQIKPLLLKEKPLGKIRQEYGSKFRKIQKIMELFYKTNKENTSNKIKKYIPSIVWMSKKFREMYLNWGGKKLDSDILLKNLENILNAGADRTFHINTAQVMESYTKLCIDFVEKGFGKIFKNLIIEDHRLIDNPEATFLSNEFLANSIKNHDESPLEILEKELGWIIKKRGYKTFFFTCMAVYELSLMTRFHPLLLFEKSEITLEEMFVPLRFYRLINFFNESKTTIFDYCDAYTEQWVGFNKICEKLGWMTFSKCLLSIYYMYSSEPYLKTYYGETAIKIIWRKTRYKTHPVKNLPTLSVFYDKIVKFHPKKGCSEYNFEKELLAKEAVFNTIKRYFLVELFSNKVPADFERTEEILNHVNSGQLDVESFLKESGIGNYLS